MAKPKTLLIDKNIEKFINNNFDKKDRKQEYTKKFEWFVNSIHIWHCSSQFFNSNTKIGKLISLGSSQGNDAFFISVNNNEQIFSIDDNIEDVVNYLKTKGKSITFHFIQTKYTTRIDWGQFLNLINVPLNIWSGLSFSESQPILAKIHEFIDLITNEDDPKLRKLEHKIEIYFYTNKNNIDISKLETEWGNDIDNSKAKFRDWFPQDKINIQFRGSDFLNEVFEKLMSNDYELLISKDHVTEIEPQKYLLGFVTAKELLDCIAPEINGNRILFPDVFKNNIRLYLGKNTVNERIETTLIEEPSKFHFYNNGITITTKEIQQNSKAFIIKPVNIVNGCQTSNSVYNVSHKPEFNGNDIKIPVKVIVAQDKEYENITIRSNTQNGLDLKDLVSITSMQKDLEEFFSESKFSDKKFYYKRQKSDLSALEVDADYIIQIDDILRSIFSTIMLIPNKVSGYFDQTTTKYIDIIFDERFTKLYMILTVAYKLIEDEIESRYPTFSRLKYHVLYIFYRLCISDNDRELLSSIFRSKTLEDITEEESVAQSESIERTRSNIYQNVQVIRLCKILEHIVLTIKSEYPELINTDTKEKEKILYKAVEKIPRIRITPVFDNFKTKFSKSIEEIIQND